MSTEASTLRARGPILYSVADTAQALGIGQTLVKRLIKTGQLPSVRIGNRRLVSAAAIADFVYALEAGYLERG